MKAAPVRVGIGGWTFEPWRGSFFPKGLPHAQELAYASRQLTAIEINGTFYRTQKPETFRSWAAATPDGFAFSLKAPRYATYRKDVSETGPAIQRFIESGVVELGDRLGPILWQFPPTTPFMPGQFQAFLDHLPAEVGGVKLGHAVEVRHPSFLDAAFIELLRERRVTLVIADSDEYPALHDVTGDFLYLRLQRARETIVTGYPEDELELWHGRLRDWQAGRSPESLAHLAPPPKAAPRPAWVYFINGAKERAPAAAQALLAKLA